jgi:integral membrane sensor domain MASE1
VQQNTSPVWPPSGIALAALLLAGIDYWPGIALGVVGGSLLTSAPLPLALGLDLANKLEALVAALLLTGWLRFDTCMGRIRDVVTLTSAATRGTALTPW